MNHLNYFNHIKVNDKCIYRLMKIMGLKPVVRCKRNYYIMGSSYHMAENMLNRELK
ncbi:hypothetical protein R0V13_07930 [Facklamia hominis]|uniref:IS3 family transposase n=2 Tax=Facklamia hominis TaxID=178214 RepID=UPI0029D41BBE|nr:IS3 family transposase [Facklamia hominis]WPJ90410.1 hypothetical protein R0V13_07930 [Facklamia hominis]